MSSDLGGNPDSELKSEVCDNINMPKSEATKNTEAKENVNSETTQTMPDTDFSEKGKSLPEPIRVGKDMPRLPPINMAELTTILQGPNMPSQKLMKEVTEKIKLKNDESSSDDGSVTGGGGVGIRGILDCILEVSLFHQDSEDESDGESDEIFVRELPCRFCKKIFGSTMNLKTHVLMTHAQEDPSVLNIRNQSWDGNRKEKLSPGSRTRSTEVREKESSTRSRKRSSAGQQESIDGKGETIQRGKQNIRSRHNSKEQSLKEQEGEITQEKPHDSSNMPQAVALDSSESLDVSSQKTERQLSHEKDNVKKCDLQSSNPETSKKVTCTQPEEILLSSSVSSSSSTSSKAPKRKSSRVSSSSPAKKTKGSQNQSCEDKGSHSVTPRRSSRRK